MVQCFQAACTHKGVPFRFTLNPLSNRVSFQTGRRSAVSWRVTPLSRRRSLLTLVRRCTVKCTTLTWRGDVVNTRTPSGRMRRYSSTNRRVAVSPHSTASSAIDRPQSADYEKTVFQAYEPSGVARVDITPRYHPRADVSVPHFFVGK